MEVEKAAKFVAWVDKEVLCPKYNGSALNDRINKIIRKTRRETLTNVITPSYDVKFLQPVIFSTSQVKSDESQDVLLAYVCIGTSAAPYSLPLYYFEHKPSNGIPKAFNLVDGELAANNPELEVDQTLVEADQQEAEKEVLVLVVWTQMGMVPVELRAFQELEVDQTPVEAY
ncbi:hypothetical protein ACFX11_025580 [Malus domestica]